LEISCGLKVIENANSLIDYFRTDPISGNDSDSFHEVTWS